VAPDGALPLTFVAATQLEFGALRRAMPSARIVRAGVGLSRAQSSLGDAVVSCGLAGGLRPDLPTGTLLIPRRVRRPDGSVFDCDRDLVEIFAQSARRLGLDFVADPLLSLDEIVCGTARAQWAAQGYAGVDMETGRIDAARIAAVRVVLDTPLREISVDWADPPRAMMKPRNWPTAFWLAREAPRAAALAARVAAAAQGIRR
jgi:hypothetical protein